MSDIDITDIESRKPWEPGSVEHERALAVPVEWTGWLALYSDVLCDLLYVSPNAKFFDVGADLGRISIRCEYVPREGEEDPERMFGVFCSLLEFVELRSETICQVCGRVGQRYSVDPFRRWTLCASHAIEKGFVASGPTEIVR